MMATPIILAWLVPGLRTMLERSRAVYLFSARQGLAHAAIATRLGIVIAELERHLTDALIHLERASREESG